MFTTEILFAHELIIVIKEKAPWKFAPKPTDVVPAITVSLRVHWALVGSAPSMPATATTASALRIITFEQKSVDVAPLRLYRIRITWRPKYCSLRSLLQPECRQCLRCRRQQPPPAPVLIAAASRAPPSRSADRIIHRQNSCLNERCRSWPSARVPKRTAAGFQPSSDRTKRGNHLPQRAEDYLWKSWSSCSRWISSFAVHLIITATFIIVSAWPYLARRPYIYLISSFGYFLTPFIPAMVF